MKLLDDEGRLFGAVNVIDALVVLFVIAVVVAGAALVFGGEEPEPQTETTYVTLDLGTHPDNVIAELNEGDSYNPSGEDTLTITDLHLTSAGGQTRAIAQVELTGETQDGTVQYEGAPPRLGRSLDIVTDRYQISGTVRQIGESQSLDGGQTDLVLEDTVDAVDAAAISPGDEIRIADRPTATVESVTRYGTGRPGQTRVFVGLSVETVTMGGTPQYGTTPVRRGTSLSFDAGEYRLDGQVVATGTTEEPGQSDTRTVTLRLDRVDERVADRLAPGMREIAGGDQMANLTAIDVEPSTVVLTSQNSMTSENATITARDHPTQRDVTITAELTVRETATDVQFKGEPLRAGGRITLDLGTTTIRPTVDRID